ncbi:hypothetical protein AFAEC_0860 [Aliarcobacter faecis]|uniref:hypothetical protein n=1 Tax=Aliarcobacter faecis TaxID=1564138 RepID=UPI00047956B1|nr:hypothetical protein [Aliarcobacter faecis]QKF73035.1 hypothetical protein AFAEC_0860 [Aliarcobacter faecis]
MVSNFAKFARTNKSLIVFSNSLDHIEVFKHFYNTRVKPNEFGFVKINDDRICLLHEDLKCDLVSGKTNEDIKNRLLEIFKTESRYIMTSSKFVIFPKKFSFKRVANRLFSDYIIQSAGEVIFNKVGNNIVVDCQGGSKVLNLKTRAIDALIIQDELESNFDE